MVGCYTQALTGVQPHGPYALAGYSYGAAIAFEIAKRLKERGEAVQLVSIDGTPTIGDKAAPLPKSHCAVILAFFLGLIGRQEKESLPVELAALSPGEDFHARIFERASSARLAELGLDLERFAHWARVSVHMVRIGEAYEPQGQVQGLTVLHAAPLSGTQQEWLEKLTAWERFSRTPPAYVQLPGEHHSLLDAPHLTVLHAALRRALGEAPG